MPNYDFVCASCSEEFEFFQSMNDDPLTQCPSCEKQTLKRKIGTGAGIIFKGSGFYETDYKRTSKEPAKSEPKQESSESASKGGSGDSGGCGCASQSEN